MTTQAPARIEIMAPQGPFRNEDPVDWTDESNVRRMREALAKVRGELGREYPLIIGGKRVMTEGKIRSINPSNPSELVGLFQKAERDHVEPAMQAALEAFETWSRTPAPERASVLFKTAAIIRDRKFEFMAWLVFEVGKNWREADGDIAELIDFLEFYGREALRLAAVEPPVQLPGERDELWYIPLGVAAVIPPWNFAGAIMGGMTSAAVVCGNTVILKPSSDSPAIAAKFVEAMEEGGLPPGVVNFCPGAGGSFGNAVVEHPKTRLIAFTGSKEVGLDIHSKAAQPRKGQLWIKRTILEMGGKDGIVVADDADIDAAVEGVAVSAFGFQGQKCSACSRLILDEKIYDAFLEKLVARVAKITVGDAAENPDMGPVVNAGSLKSIQEYIEIGKQEGRLVFGGDRITSLGDGYFLQPTIIADVAPTGRLAQEEIFGPVLAVIKAKHFDDAMDIANNTEFGLTGAIYSTSPERIERAKRDFHVGNLYVNRKCTGAIVGAHPFGGFNMSGTDSKAGGPDYLFLFTQGKSIATKV
ncbi:MAG: L-glutamate gamma-semialdehyde dehydrogenase [Candidatus Sericytochromatia bacterium]|nr:L-glutamate gamma-semialdehyde dehydrogenase [Candidatus Tanganyikabacteria bacterium]